MFLILKESPVFSKDDLPEVVREGIERVQDALESGLSFVKSSINQIPFFASVEATSQGAELRDETHYFLVPYRIEECAYVLYSTRRIPEGYAAVNDLPRLRVFHLPGSGSEVLLEELIFKDLLQRKRQTAKDDEVSVGDRLNELADEIDKHSRYVTGGLLLAGGVAAIANPLLGAGIAAKALFPALGAAFSREGLKHVGEKLNLWKREKEEKVRHAETKAEINSSGEVKLEVNPLLQALDKALDTSEEEYDPLFEFDLGEFEMTGWNSREILQLTAKVLSDVYADLIDEKVDRGASRLGPEDICWLRTLREVAE